MNLQAIPLRVRRLAQASRQQLHAGGRHVSQQRGVKQLSRYQVFGVGGSGLAVPADMASTRRRHHGQRLQQSGAAQPLAGAGRNTLTGLPGSRCMDQRYPVAEFAQSDGDGADGWSAAGNDDICRGVVNACHSLPLQRDRSGR